MLCESRLGYQHPVLRARGDGVRERQGRLAHLVDEDELVMLAGKLDAGEGGRLAAEQKCGVSISGKSELAAAWVPATTARRSLRDGRPPAYGEYEVCPRFRSKTMASFSIGCQWH
jgi:hypothetical protein